MSEGYADALEVYNTLSDADKDHLGNRERGYVDSPILLYRYVHKISNRPVGFIDCYRLNGLSHHEVFMILAVSPEYRHNNIAGSMLKKAEFECFQRGFYSFHYRVDKGNEASINLAKKHGYKKIHETKNQIVFRKEIN